MIAFRSRLELAGFAFAAVILVVLLALLVVPGSADARKQAQVRSELRQAAGALKLVWQDGDESATEEDDDYVTEGDDPADDDDGEDFDEGDDDSDADDAVTVDLEAIAANLSHTQRAQQLASKLAGSARVRALVAVGDQADENLFEYADDVAWVSGDLQPSFVAALDASAELRSSTIDKLLKRAERLAKASRAKMLASVSDALADGDPDLLLELLAEEADVTAREQGRSGRLAAGDHRRHRRRGRRPWRLSTKVPKAERGDVRAALTAIDDELDSLPDWVDELVSDMEDYDDPAAARASFCALVSGLPLPASQPAADPLRG